MIFEICANLCNLWLINFVVKYFPADFADQADKINLPNLLNLRKKKLSELRVYLATLRLKKTSIEK
jgi:hypothetical protein